MADYIGSKKTPVRACVEASGFTWIMVLVLVSVLIGMASSLRRIAEAIEPANQPVKETDDAR